MLFPTATFALFFACTLVLSAATRRHNRVWRWSMLAVSWLFYSGWDPRFVLLLAGSTVVNHQLVQLLDRQEGRRRKAAAAVGVGLNLALLAAFKYLDLGLRTVESVALWFGLVVRLPLLDVPLPVGLSFFTFEAIACTVDVYRRTAPPPRLVDFGLYLSWFPHLVAGPLVRVRELVPQLHAPAPESIELGRAGRLILGGLVMKVLVADTLATQLVDPVFERPELYGAPTVALAIYGYAAQILCDFAAYSDMAQGLSLLLGIRLPDNFNQPYRATSFQDFWRRWHMTLSRWLRDYLYIPLGGSRHGPSRTMAALMATMVLGGLWHGAAWRFVVWGGIHGGLLVGERALGLHRQSTSGLEAVLRTLVVFHVVALAWVPFRAPSLHHAGAVLGQLVQGSGAWLDLTMGVWLALAVSVAGQLVPVRRTVGVDRWLDARSPVVLAVVGGLGLMTIEALGPDGVAAFLYYQF